MEKEVAAANAFKLNYPGSTVLTDDCNLILRYVMEVRLPLTLPPSLSLILILPLRRGERPTTLASRCPGREKWSCCVEDLLARASVE